MTNNKTPPSNEGQDAGDESLAPSKNKSKRSRISARRLKKLRAEKAVPPTPEGQIRADKRLEKDWRPSQIFAPKYAAIDLGTNNCRLLVASPHKKGFRVVDAFSRIVRLGEGISQSGMLNEEAMERTIEALKICAEKIKQRRVTSLRAIATQACRSAGNGPEFIKRIQDETGLKFDLISTQEEANLSVRGCMDLAAPLSEVVVVFDIGGGTTEISWVKRMKPATGNLPPRHKIIAWTSIPMGVVTVSEKFDGRNFTREKYEEVVALVSQAILDFQGAEELRPLFEKGNGHLLGTSGTVTSIAGIHLGLKKYIRHEVDGIWLASARAIELSEKLRAMGFENRAKEPCIGVDRADLVVPGCAILEGIITAWPSNRIRVADRGLREGMLSELIAQDRKKRRKKKRRRR